MDLQCNARSKRTSRQAEQQKVRESLVQVLADLAVAEGREGEYKAGIYQFPIDYTKVRLC